MAPFFRLKHRPLTDDAPVLTLTSPRHLADEPPEPTPLTPAQLDILARAEKRLSGMIARRGVDAEVLATVATYDAMFAQAAADTDADDLDADLTALLRAVA